MHDRGELGLRALTDDLQQTRQGRSPICVRQRLGFAIDPQLAIGRAQFVDVDLDGALFLRRLDDGGLDGGTPAIQRQNVHAHAVSAIEEWAACDRESNLLCEESRTLAPVHTICTELPTMPLRNLPLMRAPSKVF